MDHIENDEITGEVDAVDADLVPQDEKKNETTQPDAPQETKESRAVTPMGLNEKGLVAPKDSSEAWRLAALFLASKAIPKQFINVPQVFMARQFLLSHGLNPEINIAKCAIINGNLSIWGELPKAICERSGLIEEFTEVICDKEYREISFENKNLSVIAWVAACTVKRKGKPPITRSFTMDEAAKAGLLSKTSSIWNLYPKRMLQMRSRSLALKDAFPDVLSGVSIAEYDFDGTLDALPPARGLLPNSMNAADEINGMVFDEEQENKGPESPQPN